MTKKIKSWSYLVCGRKMLTTQMPANSENDLVYTNVSAKKSVTNDCWVAESIFHDGSCCCIKTLKMSVVFIRPWAKIKKFIIVRNYCHSPYFSDIIFQQNGAPAHRWRHVTRLTLALSWCTGAYRIRNSQPNSPDLNPVIYCCGELCTKSCIVRKSETIMLSAFR